MNKNSDIDNKPVDNRLETACGWKVTGGWTTGGIPTFNPVLPDFIPAGKITKLPDRNGWFLWFTFDSENQEDDQLDDTEKESLGLTWRVAMLFPEIEGIVYSPTHIAMQLEAKRAGSLTQVNHFMNTTLPVTDSSFVSHFGLDQCSWEDSKRLLHLQLFKIALCTQPNTKPKAPLNAFGSFTLSLDANNQNINCSATLSKMGCANVMYYASKATWVLLQPPGMLGAQQNFLSGDGVMLGGFPYSAHGYTQWGAPWSPAPQRLAQFVPHSWK